MSSDKKSEFQVWMQIPTGELFLAYFSIMGVWTLCHDERIYSADDLSVLGMKYENLGDL